MILPDNYGLIPWQVLGPFEEIPYLVRYLDSRGGGVPDTLESPSDNVRLLVAAPCFPVCSL